MAFNFLGTIGSIEDFEAFEEFVNKEMTKIDSRIDHIQAEISRFYILLDQFQVADLKLRSEYTKSDRPDADWINNSRPREELRTIKMDALNAVDVDSLKKAVLDPIKYKRERNEFKIKRIRDLIEQMKDEKTMLQQRQSDYTDILDRIRSRFDIPDYVEMTEVAEVDPIDVVDGLRAISKNSGREVSINQVFYLVLSISQAERSITFENVAPPLKQGDTIILSEGTNDGNKTFQYYIDSRKIIVKENLVTENPSTTKVLIKGA